MKLKRLFFIIVSFVFIFFYTEPYSAATSYTNAREFYDSTESEFKTYHAEMIDGTIYYATCAKLASSSSNLRYHTLGFDITLSGNEHEVSFTVQRTGGSMKQIGEAIRSSSHEYILYSISDSTLYQLATLSDPSAAAHVLSAPQIHVEMNAILTTQIGTTLNGSILEDGSGGFTYSGTIYRLKDNQDLKEIKELFSGHHFQSYINILESLPNHLLQIRYNAQGLHTSSSLASIQDTTSSFSVLNEFIATNGTTYIQNQRVLQPIQLLHPTTIKLEKKGYHLIEGTEWITQDHRIFNAANTYMPKNIEPLVGSQNKGITLYANWQANSYTINYDANGGTGTVLPTDHIYDQQQCLRENTFSRTGYLLKKDSEWNTKADGSGKNYSTGQVVDNMTTKNNATLSLYANWDPIKARIKLDKQGGSSGTSTIYEKYASGFYSDAKCSTSLSTIKLPNKTGHTFAGYYSEVAGNGTLIIDAQGTPQIKNTFYTNDDTIYAHYIPNKYTITFDKQGGTKGSSSKSVAYHELFPTANPPIRDGYTFKGYFSKSNGEGTQYYNEHMASDYRYTLTKDLTLYAHWVDDEPPEIVLTATTNSWTSHPIKLSAEAIDNGTGLQNLRIYMIGDNETLTLVKEKDNLDGKKDYSFHYTNKEEGVIRYKAIATDQNGKAAESFCTIYYDKTAPSSRLIDSKINKHIFFFQIDVTDVNVK